MLKEYMRAGVALFIITYTNRLFNIHKDNKSENSIYLGKESVPSWHEAGILEEPKDHQDDEQNENLLQS